jgi:crotonobetaine/carnitine-CoA ligase
VTSPSSWAEAVEQRASTDAGGEIIRRAGEAGISAGALLERAVDVAGALKPLVAPGEVVATAIPSGPTAAATTTALSWLGAVELPLPTGLDRDVAGRLAAAADCVLCVATPTRLATEPHLARLGGHPSRPAITVDGPWEDLPAVDELTGPRPLRHRSSAGDAAAIMVTSGTGGRPKGALLSNGVGLGQAARVLRAMEYDASDVLLNVFPWQHVNARHAGFLPAVMSGARLVVDDFSARRFWQTASQEQVTAFNFMGAVCAILLRQPPADRDREHRVRRAYGGPAPAWMWTAMSQRFGVELRQAYACTELGDVATTGAQVLPGAAGQVVPEYAARILDEDGQPVADGATGSLEVRPLQPHLTFTRYVGEPETTRAAWHGEWFVTGDRARLSEGWLYYDGRMTDTIRRRGLTVDAEHVEWVASAHPDVHDVAAIGVPSELTEDEVLLVVVPREGSALSPEALRTHCADRLSRHAVPRYISVESAVPRTASMKINRRSLRDRGLPPGAWDAETCHATEEIA